MAKIKRKTSFRLLGLKFQRTSVFGGDLNEMTSEDNKIPTLVEKMIQDIEFRGKNV